MKTLLFIYSIVLSSSAVCQEIQSFYFENDKDFILNQKEINLPMEVDSIHLFAYTDTTGTKSYNLDLASRRAQFIQRHLPTDLSITTTIIGESNDKAFDQNRRVDLIFHNIQLDSFVEVEEIVEEKAKPKDSILLQIEFYNNSPVFKPEFKHELEKLLDYMKRHPTYNAELHGHVCCGPGYELSLARAKAVKLFLINGGIPPNRITCIGHSNSKPLVPETSEENQQRNRRVECFFF